MNVSFIVDSLRAGGKEKQLFYLIRGISSSHSVQLILFHDIVYYDEIFQLPVKVEILHKSSKSFIANIISLNKLLNGFQPDIVHSWISLGTIMVLPHIVRHKNVRLVSSIRYAGKIRRSLFGKAMHQISYHYSDSIISNSAKGLEVEKLIGCSKAITIYNGIDTAVFFNYKRETTTSKLPKFIHKVIMVGNFTDAKDYSTFIRAAEIVISKMRDVCFICVGDGFLRKKNEFLAGKLLNESIYFLGLRNDIPALLKSANVGILLSNTNGHAEGISNSIMEYMAAGLPVIATNAGGTPEIVKDGINGYLVPAFNAQIVAERITYLLQHTVTANEMGKNGQDLICNKFSVEKMIREYENHYIKIRECRR